MKSLISVLLSVTTDLDRHLRRHSPVQSGSPSALRLPPAPRSLEPPPQPPDLSSAAPVGSLCPRQRIQRI